MDDSNVRKAFGRVINAAGLPGHFTPHSLRHTFASLLLQHGKSPEYVREQMGHASIQITVDLYGRWLPKRDRAAVDALDDVTRPQVVAAGSRMVAAKSGTPREHWSRGRESNPRPTDYESVALPL